MKNTGLKRFWAAILDGIVFMPLVLIDRWIYTATNNYPILIGWHIFITFSPIVYSIILHYKYGQTIGKWVAGLKVVDISETRGITLQQSPFRDSFYLAIELTGLLYFLFLSLNGADAAYLFMDYKNLTGTPALLWILLELASMLTNSKRRAIHDYLAKSVVERV